jgi:hypothetical protein
VGKKEIMKNIKIHRSGKLERRCCKKAATMKKRNL